MGWLLIIVLGLLLLMAGSTAYAAYRLGLFEPRLPFVPTAAEQLMSAPNDPQAAAAVTRAFEQAGVTGAQVVVVPAPEATGKPAAVQAPVPSPVIRGNVAVVVLDPARGFKPPAGAPLKLQQALQVIKNLAAADANNNLQLQRLALQYQESGKPLVALTAPMQAIRDLAAGRINQRQFLRTVAARIRDVRWVVDQVRKRLPAGVKFGMGSLA